MRNAETLEVNVGESITAGGLLSGEELVYSGMVGGDTYSIARYMGVHTGYLTLFFPTDMHQLTIGKERFDVSNVTPQKISLTYKGKA